MEKEVLVSPEGLKKLEDELEHLKTVRRREVAERIKQAREFGDISENSEYEDAKNDQAFIEGRILVVEKMLRNAKIVDAKNLERGLIGIGTTVHLLDLASNEEFSYTIVGAAESDPIEGRISNESPVGKALMGQHEGETVEIHAPVGALKYKVLAVTK